MKRKVKFLIEKVAPLIAILGGVALSIKSCYLPYNSSDDKGSHSQYVEVTGSVEYFSFKDGSEEIKFTGNASDKAYITRCHNFDGDNTTDQIEIYQKGEGDSLTLEQMLDRKKDFESNRHLFERADELLLKLRNKN